jgi:hypothetical protein
LAPSPPGPAPPSAAVRPEFAIRSATIESCPPAAAELDNWPELSNKLVVTWSVAAWTAPPPPIELPAASEIAPAPLCRMAPGSTVRLLAAFRSMVASALARALSRFLAGASG